MIGAARELDLSSAYIRLKKPDKSKDKVEQVNVATKEAKENRISASPTTGWRRSCMGFIVFPSTKGNYWENVEVLKQVVKRGEETTTSPEGLNYPKAKHRLEWRGRTFMELSISCSHKRRGLVVKGAEEVENIEANSKYQDKVEGQKPENFIRSVSTGFSSRYPKVEDFGVMQECSNKERSRQYVVLNLFDSEE
ncbi:hypothetical protein GW17_00000241 [Ensete ventricosum]|nr:hypothetical protein GW17_00000241 [Ensete ventricosum]RZS17092.1 hypothetical protein BHM03_00049202 [Ensete ventricosum]